MNALQNIISVHHAASLAFEQPCLAEKTRNSTRPSRISGIGWDGDQTRRVGPRGKPPPLSRLAMGEGWRPAARRDNLQKKAKDNDETMTDRLGLCAFASFTALIALGVRACAQEATSSDSEIKLGSIPRFADESSAMAACSPDGVVWADKKNGFFYPKFLPQYGKTEHGTFTCYRQAKDADYWSLAPTYEDGHRGREFPLFFCYACS
jgi:hypothetical protein